MNICSLTFTIVLAVVILLAPRPASSDWSPSDDYKMHYPQLPDPNGWDIDVTTDTVYDDFRCTQTGPIEDLHFWVSWKGDVIGQISWIDVSLHKDVPLITGPGVPHDFGHPDSVMYDTESRLWFQRFLPGQFTQVPAGTSDQGWIAPSNTQPLWNRPDHQQFFQINIPKIDAPFIQKLNTVYYIGIHIGVEQVGTEIGWKTSLDNWGFDAVNWYGGEWRQLTDPVTGASLDMAFVITPEPASLTLIILAAMAILPKR